MKATLLEELALSERIVRIGAFVVPRFLILTPDGEYRILMPLHDDIAKHKWGMHFVTKRPFLRNLLELLEADSRECAFTAWKKATAGFMAWKKASAFVLAGELEEPDAIIAFAVCRDGRFGVTRPIEREPLSFGANHWLEEDSVGPALRALLPSGEASVDRETEADLECLFGEGGEFQAHKLDDVSRQQVLI